MDWELFANIATAISGISILFAVFSLVHELKQQRWDQFTYLDERLSTDLLNDARVTIREGKIVFDEEGKCLISSTGSIVREGCLRDKPLSEWSPDDRMRANLVCDSFSSVGLMLKKGYLSKRLLDFFLSEEVWGRCIIIQYEALKDFVDEMSETEGLYPSFRWLYDEAKKREGN